MSDRDELSKMVNAITSVAAEISLNNAWPSVHHSLTSGVVMICGVGKSYNVAALAASLLQSVGMQAVSMHATDVVHGGRGLNPAVGIYISHSGETPETVRALMLGVKDGMYTIGITAGKESPVARFADTALSYECTDGSDHKSLPTASITAQLAWINMMAARFANDLSAHDLLINHPGGELAETYRKEMTS